MKFALFYLSFTLAYLARLVKDGALKAEAPKESRKRHEPFNEIHGARSDARACPQG
jgi:hypothetical protein